MDDCRLPEEEGSEKESGILFFARKGLAIDPTEQLLDLSTLWYP